MRLECQFAMRIFHPSIQGFSPAATFCAMRSKSDAVCRRPGCTNTALEVGLLAPDPFVSEVLPEEPVVLEELLLLEEPAVVPEGLPLDAAVPLLGEVVLSVDAVFESEEPAAAPAL